MEKAKGPGIWLVTTNETLIMEMTWTLERANIGETATCFATPGDARDELTTRIRDGGLPVILAVDVRANTVGGSQLVKWVASTEGLSQIMVIAFMSHGTAANVMHLLGADVVFETCPDAAKLAQLHGIACQLGRIPASGEPRPGVASKPVKPSAKAKSGGRGRKQTR